MIKTELFDHQSDVLEMLKLEPYYGVFMEQGTGKTLTLIAYLDWVKKRNKTVTALVVCPNTITDNWLDEVSKHSDLSCIVLSGTKPTRLKRLTHEADVFIINYESTRILARELKEKKFDVLILDESQNIKHFKSLQSKACYDISQSIPKRYILTGTPVTQSPLDIFAQYRVLDPSIFGISFYRFRNRYAVMGGFMGKQPIQWRNMDSFKQRVFACAVRKTKAECLDLPDKLYQVIKLDLPDQQAHLYKTLKKEFIFEFSGAVVTAPIVLTRLMRFSQITAGFTKDVEGNEHEFEKNPKVTWLIDFLNDLPVTDKVVVFVRFKKEIAMLERAFGVHGIKSTAIHGAIKDRISRIKRFNEDKDTRVFIGQIQTAGVGINLTAASYCVFMSNSYSYGDRIQAEDRLHRIGQTRNITYIDLLMRNTVDVRIHSVLRKKESLAGMVTGDIVRMV